MNLLRRFNFNIYLNFIAVNLLFKLKYLITINVRLFIKLTEITQQTKNLLIWKRFY